MKLGIGYWVLGIGYWVLGISTTAQDFDALLFSFFRVICKRYSSWLGDI